jgi:hypothetical protein
MIAPRDWNQPHKMWKARFIWRAQDLCVPLVPPCHRRLCAVHGEKIISFDAGRHNFINHRHTLNIRPHFAGGGNLGQFCRLKTMVASSIWGMRLPCVSCRDRVSISLTSCRHGSPRTKRQTPVITCIFSLFCP